MPQKKHILFISSWYPNRNNPVHGIFNRYFAQAASINNKISILHVCSDDNLKTDIEIAESSEGDINTLVIYYKKINSTLPFISQFLKRQKVISAFDLGYQKILEAYGKPDLIQLNVVMPAGIGAFHLSKKHNIPYIINENWTGYTPEDGNYKGFLMKVFTKKIVAHAQALMPVSEHLKKAMLSHGLTGNYTIVENVVDTDRFVPKEIPKNTVTKFLHISSLDDEQKNVTGIIRAFAKAVQSGSKMELNIVGEGKEKAMLQQLANDLGLEDKVKFKGRLMGLDIVDEINNNNALVMFSNYETFCLVIAEAFSCGKPVLASRAGGIADHITPGLGIAFRSRDEKALTQAFIDFASGKIKYDEKVIRDFAVSNFSEKIIGEKLDRVYKTVLKEK